MQINNVEREKMALFCEQRMLIRANFDHLNI